MDIGFPELTDSFLQGQDILYGQFNDINFYVEDEDQENLYYAILKKIFPDTVFEKIFPLNGKTKVIDAAQKNILIENGVYIVDKDFDDILNKIHDFPNLFYIDRYSIENYLIEENAIHNIIIEERPKIKLNEVQRKFDYNLFIKESFFLFDKLIRIYAVTQLHSLGITNVSNNPQKFCVYTPACATKREEFINYVEEVKTLLRNTDEDLELNDELYKIRKYFSEDEYSIQSLANIPGKYLMAFLKEKLHQIFFVRINMESFVYRLANKCEFSSLDNFKLRVTDFMR